MPRPAEWTRGEDELVVADYLTMLAQELAGQSFSKAQHNAALQRLLPGRARGSIEFKHANISAVLLELGYPYVDGYKRRSNYQELLREVVVERWNANSSIQTAAAAAVAAPVVDLPTSSDDWSSVLVDAPKRETRISRTFERPPRGRPPASNVNYLERESRNSSLGAAGEEFVLKLESRRLWQQGRRRLADRVEHVARTQGDGLGYDILSFEPNGRERMIEVKTTRFGSMTPFFATRNEVDVSDAESESYHLYRVFKFEKEPRIFILPGRLRDSVVLDPMVFRASLP